MIYIISISYLSIHIYHIIIHQKLTHIYKNINKTRCTRTSINQFVKLNSVKQNHELNKNFVLIYIGVIEFGDPKDPFERLTQLTVAQLGRIYFKINKNLYFSQPIIIIFNVKQVILTSPLGCFRTCGAKIPGSLDHSHILSNPLIVGKYYIVTLARSLV